jgi:hypothetical protein
MKVNIAVEDASHFRSIWNPVKAGFCKLPEEYKHSSAPLYETGIDNPFQKKN